jgi:type VII secretion protein EccB
MQTRREQVRAYRFVTRRLVSALLSGEPETTDLPMRRLGMAVFGSLLVGAIIFGGVGAYGALRPGGGGPPADNSLVIERETGARYVFRDGTLYPVANFASALLIVGKPDPVIQTRSRNSLRGLPRSRQTYGIQGAPDSLPDPRDLSGLPWSVCSAPKSADSTTPATRVLVGSQPPGGSALGESGLLVLQGNNRYLLWNNHALRIPNPGILAALGMAGPAPVAVGPALINGMVKGPELKVPLIPGQGTPTGKTLGGKPATTGSLYHDDKGQHYIMLTGGLSPIGETMAGLIVATTGQQDNALNFGELNGVLTNHKFEPDGFPQQIPKLAQPTATRVAVCDVYTRVTDTEMDSTVLVYDAVPAELVPSAAEVPTTQTNRADFVTVSGQGALVNPVPAPGAAGVGGDPYLVTAEGFRYTLDSRSGDAKGALGYAAVTPVEIPEDLVLLIPAGPALSMSAALNQANQPAKPAAPAARPPSPSLSPSPSPRASKRPPASPRPSASAAPSGSQP